jgi:hypothetical protein
MKPKDIFGLIVRLLGLIFLYKSAENVPLAISYIFPLYRSFSGPGILSAFFLVGWPLAVAYWFLRGAPPISTIAYPDDPK